MERRGILTKDQREAVKADYRNLSYHPNKMRSDIKTQIESLEADLRILKQHDTELYEKTIEHISIVMDEE